MFFMQLYYLNLKSNSYFYEYNKNLEGFINIAYSILQSDNYLFL